MDELAPMIELCRRLGSPPAQAEAMARQLLKRADQLAQERNLTREAAMEYLLQLVVQGRQGRVDERFAASAPSPVPGASEANPAQTSSTPEAEDFRSRRGRK